jgi:hypothetical protein
MVIQYTLYFQYNHIFYQAKLNPSFQLILKIYFKFHINILPSIYLLDPYILTIALCVYEAFLLCSR